MDILAHDLHEGELRTYRVASALLSSLPRDQRSIARGEMIERAAYTWINRLFALRAMEVRQLIDSTLRGDEAYGGLSEKLYFLRQDKPDRASGPDGGWWAVLEDACKEQAKALPGLFALSDPNAALRPSPATLVQCIELVNGTQPVLPDVKPNDMDSMFADPDAIGWAYQFYQGEAKASIDAKCKSGGKVASRAELAAKTQLFTEPYMVQWLLQNSLGRSYHEVNPQSSLPATWDYYIEPEQLDTLTSLDLARLTLLDPCMGSGHFLRVAFDMFVAMYREQHPDLSAKEIADRILSQHLHGIDLDPRAAQLAALTLYLRAWELVRDEQRKVMGRRLGSCVYIPPVINLATTPIGLTKGALERHLRRVPEDRIFKSLLENIFTGLEHAHVLGSLLRPREYLDSAIEELLKPQNLELESDWSTLERLREIQKIAAENPAQLRDSLLDTIANSFKIEAGNTDDVSIALFGCEAEQGVRLLQLLNRQYEVVVTNPPYLGSTYMDSFLKRYVAKHYPSGKRDLYATFILRCLELCKLGGRLAMITMQSWMFLSSFVELRAVPDEKLVSERKKDQFTGLLRETKIEVLAHLGPKAFEEISGEVVQSTIFILANRVPFKQHRMIAYRLVGLKNVVEKEDALRLRPIRVISQPYQADFLEIPGSPIIYWLRPHYFQVLKATMRLKDVASVKRGLDTGNDARFVRFWWEVTESGWITYSKGGGYSKWFGLDYYRVDWRSGNVRFSDTPGARVQNVRFYFHPFITYSLMASGSLGVRVMDSGAIPSGAAGGIYPFQEENSYLLCALMNARVTSYLLRFISPDLKFREGYVANIPEFAASSDNGSVSELARLCVQLKKYEISLNPIESSYLPNSILSPTSASISHYQSCLAIRHMVEGVIDRVVSIIYGIYGEDLTTLLEETSTPVGWYPLITEYDTLPTLPEDIDLLPLPKELFDYLAAYEKKAFNGKELAHVKAKLKALYEARPGAKEVEYEENEENSMGDDDEEETTLGAHIPIPTETFLEELSAKMELHPISVYWLLEELRAERIRCKPEEKRLLEDRLSVLVLRLLGHRWPKQLEAGEPVPTWADAHGIIPLVPGTGKPTLADRLRERMYYENSALVAQYTETLLQELTGQNIEQWLRRSFFSNHVRQFKYRPVAWHLASTPTRGSKTTSNKNTKKKFSTGSASRGPAFECLLYYHTCSKGTLARIRMQYVEPLLNAERSKIERHDEAAGNPANKTEMLFQVHDEDDVEVTIAKERIRELEDFATRLQKIEEEGFASPELSKLLEDEPLDRWCGDGYDQPASFDEFRRNEEAWHVDINDGVRVNITPLQLAGVLAGDVLKPADAKKAITDRARWRADERRWVREGKLPHCGWMDKDVPPSSNWLERKAPHNEDQVTLQQLALHQRGNEV